MDPKAEQNYYEAQMEVETREKVAAEIAHRYSPFRYLATP